jgi:hypothetical protein
MTTQEKADKLEHWSDYEGTELGEYWTLLTTMYLNYEDCFGLYDFKNVLEKEIEIQYDNACDLMDEGVIEME